MTLVAKSKTQIENSTQPISQSLVKAATVQRRRFRKSEQRAVTMATQVFESALNSLELSDNNNKGIDGDCASEHAARHWQ